MAQLGSSIFPASDLGSAGHALRQVCGGAERVWLCVVDRVAQGDVLVRVGGVCLVQIVPYEERL